ncbi:retrovirus-related Pol polyprotein from transposon 17.6 [Trichonephila clavipes]|nr:retrovirus-related Pol polyprotein from transposon 17.6 [Trichonephila clavipes]
MSFLLKGKKEDLLELATELGLETTVDMAEPMLKNAIIKSAGYDEEDTKLMYEDTPPSRDYDRRAPRRYYIFHSLDHLSFNCPKAMKVIKREQPNPRVQSCSLTPQKVLQLKSTMLGNEIVSALIDTGSTVSLIQEDISVTSLKNDLTRITSSYKPEKTESPDVTRRIILNDDIPVCQPARLLSYAEKKSVNKHIEESLEQGIVRPSSSEYASPIVFLKNQKTCNKKRKNAPEYQIGDLVAAQRTQFGGSLKLRPSFFGPYQMTEVKPRDRYTVEKGENNIDVERDRRERRDSGFTGEKPRFSDCHGWLGCCSIFDDFFQHLWPYIGNNTANVVFQMVKRLWLIRIDR